MNSQKIKSIVQTTLSYGAIGALIAFIWTTVLTRSGVIWNPVGTWLGYAAIIIMPIFTFLAVRHFTVIQLQGKAQYGYSILIGLMLSVFAAGIYSGLKGIETRLVPDVFKERLLKETEQEMRLSQQSDEQINRRLKQINNHYQSWKPIRNTFIWYTSLGLIYSTISFFILKIKPPKYHSP